MSNPFTTSQSFVPAAPLHEILNIAHSRPLALLFVNYSWMIGAAGGLTIIWAIYVLTGRRRGVEYLFAMPLAAALVIGGFLNVLSETGQPSRLLYGYFLGWQDWNTSIMKYGITLLPLYLVVCWLLTFQSLDRQSLAAAIERLSPPLRRGADILSFWSRHYSVLDSSVRGVTVGVVIFLSLFAPMYSGIFLMDEHGSPIWNAASQPLMFLATSVAMGALMMLVLLPALAWLATGSRAQPLTAPLRWTAAISISIAAVMWFARLWWMSRFGTVEALRAAQLYMGPYASAMFWNWAVPGVLLPLVLLISPLGRQRWAQFVAMLGVFWGCYALRALILFGGEALIRSGAGYEAFTPSAEMLRDSGFSVLTIIGVLAVLLLARPADKMPEINVKP